MKRLRAAVVLASAVSCGVAAQADVQAQAAEAETLRVRPAVLHVDDLLFGVRLTSGLSRSRDLIGAYPRSWHLAGYADAPVFTHAARNPEPLSARVDAGLQLSLFRPSTPVGAVPSPDDPPPWNFGYIVAGLTAKAAAPQTFDNADLTIGAIVAYEHDQYHALWFMPEMRVALDAVLCMECDTVDDGTQRGWRFDGAVAWSVPVDRGRVPRPLRPLWLRLDGRAFHTSGLDAATRNQDGLWGSAEVAYRCDACGPVHEVYVRAHGGRVPIALRERRAVTAGISLFF